jgi:glutaconate CoA-transferase subunit B
VAVTTMGVYRFDNETREMYLEKIHPGVKLEDIKRSIQWDIAISPDLVETEPPTEEQVMVMRTLDPLKVYLGNGRELLAGDFEAFMKMFEDSWEPMNELIRRKGMA